METTMKIIGRRKIARGLEEMDRLQQLVRDMRGNRGLCPRGVYRFKSFEEADRWLMNALIKSTRESQR